MDYNTVQETARKWEITPRQIQHYCVNNKIPGAVKKGHQWLIPMDATRPADGRYLASRSSKQIDTYHFPALAFSKYYSSHDELSEDERLLFDAQILNLKGEFTESVRICKSLLGKNTSPSVTFGAYFANALNYQMLGLASEIPSCIKAMEKVYKHNPLHQEDYQLLLSFLAYNFSFDSSPFFSIDVSKLSPEAIILYEYLSILIAFFSAKENSDPVIGTFHGICREADLLGIAPISLMLHAILATLCSRKGNKGAEELHIKEVCRIGHDTGLLRLLSKAYAILRTDVYYDCLCKYGKAFANKVEVAFQNNTSKWKLAYNKSQKTDIKFFVTSLEYEIVTLLMYKTSVRDIAMLKGLSEQEVRHIIKDLCDRCSLSSREDLVDYFKRIFLPTN